MSVSIRMSYMPACIQINLPKVSLQLVQTMLWKWLTLLNNHHLKTVTAVLKQCFTTATSTLTHSLKIMQTKTRLSPKFTARGGHLPCEDHNEIHHVPTISEVRAFVKNKPQSNDLYTSFKTKYSNKVRLSVILQRTKSRSVKDAHMTALASAIVG